jgi:hypothetical protein
MFIDARKFVGTLRSISQYRFNWHQPLAFASGDNVRMKEDFEPDLCAEYEKQKGMS